MGRKKKNAGFGAECDAGDGGQGPCEAPRISVAIPGALGGLAPNLAAANPQLAAFMATRMPSIIPGMPGVPGPINNPVLDALMMGRSMSSLLPSPPPPAPLGMKKNEIDPDIQELCDHYEIEERIAKKLHEQMDKRPDTFSDDLEKLWEVLKTARSPAGLLCVKIGEMETGTWVGKPKLDKEFEAFARRYSLDFDAKTKLADVLHLRQSTKREDLREIEKHLETASRPSAMVMMLLSKLRNGEKLPDPPRSAGSKGGSKGDRDSGSDRRDRDRSRDRDGRERDRERKRSRSRQRSKSRRRSRSR